MPDRTPTPDSKSHQLPLNPSQGGHKNLKPITAAAKSLSLGLFSRGFELYTRSTLTTTRGTALGVTVWGFFFSSIRSKEDHDLRRIILDFSERNGIAMFRGL